MKTSYKEEDVIILLKDITGELQPFPIAEREKQIQQGVPSSEMFTTRIPAQQGLHGTLSTSII